jgi:hypothetical protein
LLQILNRTAAASTSLASLLANFNAALTSWNDTNAGLRTSGTLILFLALITALTGHSKLACTSIVGIFFHRHRPRGLDSRWSPRTTALHRTEQVSLAWVTRETSARSPGTTGHPDRSS